MFFALSKILYFLLIPLNWIIVLLFLALYLRKQRKALIILSSILLYLYSSAFILNFLFQRWEYPPIWYKDISANYDAAIVLGGMAAPGKKPDDRTHFPGSPDRLLHAMQLYKLGKVKKIIISGGSGEISGKKITEAEYLKNVLLLCNVNSGDILFENQSRNTYENAVFTNDLIKINIANKSPKFLLITSAWHMKRSMGCYSKKGIDVTAFSVDSQIPESANVFINLLPNPVNISRWQILIHEYFGYVSYKISGYL